MAISIVRRRLSTDSQNVTLNDLKWTFRAKLCYRDNGPISSFSVRTVVCQTKHGLTVHYHWLN